MAIEDRMDGAFGRNPDIAVEPPDQQFPDLARAPVRFFGLEADDQALDLLRPLTRFASYGLASQNNLQPKRSVQRLSRRSPFGGRRRTGGRELCLDKPSVRLILSLAKQRVSNDAHQFRKASIQGIVMPVDVK